MRKKFLLPLILWATMLVLFSCQKEFENQNTNNNQGELISKVNGWLDKQKSPTQPNKAANIDLLKENLNFTELKFEDLNQSEKFLIIPVNEDYETKKNIDKKTVLVLLLVMDKSTNIIRGNLVLYSPEDNHRLNEIPENTFFKMYNNKSLECNGLFNFLSVTGRKMYQREYKDGKLHSFGYVKASNKKPDEASNQAVARTETDCTHYYYILTWWIDGVPVYQEAIYLGSICAGGCDDPMNQTLCPDDGGGGGGGNGDGVEYDACISAAVSGFQSEANGTQAVSETIGFDISIINEVTKNKNPKWRILKGWSGWDLESQEVGVIKLIDEQTNQWAWKSLTHGLISMVGSPPPGVSVEYNQGVGTPSFTSETAEATIVLYGGMSLNFNVTYRLLCNCPNLPLVGQIPPVIRPYNSTAIWNSKPI